MSPDVTLLLLAAANLPIAATALLADRLFGYPDWLHARIGHPVEWTGKLIGWLDRAANAGERRKLRGIIALLVLCVVTLALTVPLTLFLRGHESGWLAEALLAATLLSQKSLEDHVRAVADGLKQSLRAGRDAVRHIVGRDPDTLDESGVTKGALESLAENFSDGVIAPLFWLLVAGLPGAALYKAINTADSMIGYRTERYLAFGWASARLDDMINLIPARLAGLLIVLAAALTKNRSGASAVRTMARDARNHLSPNAGWPEAAMAGALGIRLGGPRAYQGKTAGLAWMGRGREKLSPGDIENGLRLYNAALNVVTMLVIAACAITWLA